MGPSILAFAVAVVIYAAQALELTSGLAIWGHLFVAIGLALGGIGWPRQRARPRSRREEN